MIYITDEPWALLECLRLCLCSRTVNEMLGVRITQEPHLRNILEYSGSYVFGTIINLRRRKKEPGVKALKRSLFLSMFS